MTIYELGVRVQAVGQGLGRSWGLGLRAQGL